ncbi:MAG TPA: M4 family metallopeptidase [Bacillales bacterium]|nr:M4 family metallopeptidase [Bacillales bacterium]
MTGKPLLTLVLTASLSLLPAVAYAQGNGSSGPADQHEKHLQQFKKWSDDHFTVVWRNENKVPTFVSGTLSKQKMASLSDVRNYLRDHQELFKLNPHSDLNLEKHYRDKLGMTHYRFVQSVNGIPVEGADFTVNTDKHQRVSAVTGAVQPNIADHMEGDLSANLSKQEALQKAWNQIGLSPDETRTIGGTPHDTSQQANLVVYPHNGKGYLAYHVQLRFLYPEPGNWQIYVDANDGSVIHSYNAIMESGPSVGYGYDIFGNKRTLHTYHYNNRYYLADTSKPMRGWIETFTANNGESLPGYNVSDGNNAFTSQWQRAAVSAQYNVGKVYDYYKYNFGRNSYNDNGAVLNSTVHYGSNYNNAFWNGSQMVYGDGDGQTFLPLAGSLEVTAHELTHAVTQSTANLEYYGQSGALNESFSDTFAYFVHPNNFLMGEDVYTPGRSGDAIRSMSNPSEFGQPETMSDYVNTSRDNGGVHTNSGIPNKAAYLTIKDIGRWRAQQIYYRALTVYMGPHSQFSDARAALLQAAADYYGYGKEYRAVQDAWNAVGVR